MGAKVLWNKTPKPPRSKKPKNPDKAVKWDKEVGDRGMTLKEALKILDNAPDQIPTANVILLLKEIEHTYEAELY